MGDSHNMNGRTGDMTYVGEGTRSDFRQGHYRELMFSKTIPDLVDLVINGKTFTASTGTGTGHAGVYVLPTTTAGGVIYNSSATLSIVPLVAWAYLMSGTRAIGTSLWATASLAQEATAPTAYTNSVAGAMNTTSTAVGVFDSIVTLDAASAWVPIAAAEHLADANESSALVSAPLDGMFVIPPKMNFCTTVYGSAAGTAQLWGYGFVWAELDLNQ